MSGFRDELTKLTAREMVSARRDPDRLAEMVEALLASLSFTIAAGTHGNREAASQLMEGCIAHLTETVTANGNIAESLFRRPS